MSRQEITPASRDEWLALRKGRITSSVVAACLGLDPHCTPLEAWVRITGRDTFEGNEATLRGTLLEPVVLDYPTRDGLTRLDAPFVVDDWRGDSADCLYRAYGTTLVGEGKTVALPGAGDYGRDGTDEVPDRVIIQALWHLAHWPHAEACLIPLLIGGYVFEFRCYRVARAGNEDVIANLLEDAERFHRDHVATDMPPQASPGDDAALHHLYPRHLPGQWAPATAEARELAAEYAAAREAVKEAERRKSTAGARLKQHVGDAEGIAGDGYKVLWRQQAGRAATDWEAIARDIAGGNVSDDLIQRHTKLGSGFRVLRVTMK